MILKMGIVTRYRIPTVMVKANLERCNLHEPGFSVHHASALQLEFMRWFTACERVRLEQLALPWTTTVIPVLRQRVLRAREGKRGV